MENEIIESGFIKGFINTYYEDKVHVYYPDKDRLLYAFCNTDEERRRVTLKEIKKAKSKIKTLGYEYLSSAYLLSCKPESLVNYIEYNKRYDFWLNRFVQEFEENFQSFHPIHDALLLFTNKKELEASCFENDSEFWEAYPKRLSPKIKDLPLLIGIEVELEEEIQFVIEERKMTPEEIESYKKSNKDFRESLSAEEFEKEFQYTDDDFKNSWEIDFEEFEKYVKISKPLEDLFSLSELLVQLERLDMLKSFIDPFSIKQINKPNLKIDRIALKYVYERGQITRENSDEIVKSYGHNSGERLFQRFTYFSSATNRKNVTNPCTPKKLKNRIELIEGVYEHISEEATQWAMDEVKILKTKLQSEYE